MKINNLLFQARHHLAAATHILFNYQSDMIKPSMTDDERKAAEDNFNHRLADVHRCWIKYGLNLLSDSRDRLLQDAEDGKTWSIFSNELNNLLIFLYFQA